MKFLIIIASVLSLVFAQDVGLCDDLEENTRLPSDVSCSEYLECINNSPVRRECPPGQYFDLNTSECNDSENVECAADTTTNAPVTRPGPQINCTGLNNFDYVPSPVSCSEYYQCIDNDAFLISCPRGLYFSRERQTCTYPNQANCVLDQPETIPPPPTRPPPTISCVGVPNFRFVRSLMSCENYYQCIDGNAFLLSCPVGQFFDEQRQTCDRAENVDCPIVQPPPPPIAPPTCNEDNNFRFIRNPLSCTEYFQCLNGTAFLFACPRGLYFNELIQTCDYPSNVECVTIPPGLPTTTTSPPLGVSCEGVANLRLLAHPVSCAMYYQCINEEALLAFCPIGRYFDEPAQSCLDSDSVNCGARTRRPTTTSVPPIEDPQCRGIAEGRLVTNVNSCTTYYECLNGRAWPRFCDGDLWFDEELQACDLQERVNCPLVTSTGNPSTEQDNDDVCEGEDNEVYVGSRTHCEIFYFCVNGNAYQSQCQDGLWFDRERRQCYPMNKVDCTLETLATTTVITTTTDSSPLGLCRVARNGTYVRNSMACGEFFVCIDEEPHGRICPSGLWFNFIQQRCTPFYQASCELDPIVCLGVEEDVVVRAPASCSDFFSCYNGVPFPSRCFGNYFFNEETGLCEPREDVDCDLDIPEEPQRGPCDGAPDFRVRGSWESCTLYHVCYANEIIADLQCPEGQNFDQETEVCGEEFECLLN